MKRLFLLICTALIATLTWAQGLPEEGGTYYIYCDNDQPQYFFNETGSLAVANTCEMYNPAFLWHVGKNGDAYTIQSASNPACYFGFKEMVTSPYDWTIGTENAFVEGNVTMFGAYGGRNVYMVMKNTGAFDQASKTYNKATTDFSSDYCFVKYIPQDNTPIRIECNLPQARGEFTLGGSETKTGNCTFYYVMTDAETVPLTGRAGNAAYRFEGFYLDGEFLGTEVNADGLGAVTLQAVFSLDIFSEAYGEKWLRFGTVEDENSAACSMGNDTPMHTKLDIGSEAYLWCFVGTADDYVIYNKAIGSEQALTADNAEKATAVYFTSTEQARHWTLIDTYATAESNAGYVITLIGTTDMGINCYGGETGFPIKFWNAYGAGTHWNFERVSERSIKYTLTGTNPYPDTNTRVAYLDVKYGNTTTHVSLTRDNGEEHSSTVYLPANEQITVTENVRYRGYQLQGVEYGEDGTVTVSIYADPENKYQYLWYSNSPEGHPYRIPAIAKAYDGTLVAVSDYRPCNNDIGYGEVDLVMRRSSDNGQTWTSPVTIADGTGVRGTMACGFGDAALVADRESGNLLLICVGGSVVYTGSTRANSNNVCRFRSSDNGQTWSQAEDITEDIYGLFDSDPSGVVNGLFFGSGRIFQSRIVKEGDYYRLYAALCARPNGNRVIYSDDFGQTWKPLGGVAAHPVPSGDEPKCEELPNGNVVISSRKSGGRYFNVFKFDDETYTTGAWGNALQSNQQENGITVGGNSCNGEIMTVYAKRTDGQYPNNVYPIMLQSLPWGSGRSNVGIWWKALSFNTTYNYTSELFSRNWNQGLEVSDRSSAYSTMCLQADNRIGFFYEEGPNSYCMVYVPLTLEEITNGQYRVYDPKEDGIISLMGESDAASTAIYTLSGQRVSKAEKPGIYVMGGRKVLIK